ncbi:PREDICTED: lithostathine-like [Galeopterus variegatus]|uniref:Lithostathine-like n=1 Tax=Galeopterus variegatus TaxID=482537 RepID=A0ABM0S649_GALVR|nr:PREDICTED: lithostathine-like [Galeopterus variegatus]
MALTSMSWVLLSCLMLLSQVQGEDARKELPSARISCPKGSKAYASHCYALFTTPKSWVDADLACQKRPSGHLVSVLSGAEASFVSSLVKNTVNTFSYIWIGLHDPTQTPQAMELGPMAPGTSPVPTDIGSRSALTDLGLWYAPMDLDSSSTLGKPALTVPVSRPTPVDPVNRFTPVDPGTRPNPADRGTGTRPGCKGLQNQRPSFQAYPSRPSQ